MNQETFVSGWQRLLAAFDVKKSNEHMKIVFENVRAFEKEFWPIVVEKIIKEAVVFPKIAILREYLFEELHKHKINYPQPKEAINESKYVRIPKEYFPEMWAISKIKDKKKKIEEEGKFLKKCDQYYSKNGPEFNFENIQI